MASMNMAILIGRLTADVELRYTPNGRAAAAFTLAVDRTYGENKQTDFIRCVAWEKTAENMAQYVGKGSMVSVEGRIQVRTYEDKNGKRQYATEVVANRAQFLGPRKGEADDGGFGGNREAAGGMGFSEEDIPF
jgi:single-strand DNA-binding protein